VQFLIFLGKKNRFSAAKSSFFPVNFILPIVGFRVRFNPSQFLISIF
jgi:hypothetical protein